MITNVVQLSGTRLDEDLDAVMGWGSFPARLLPGFLHELTHHWCFLSPVGFILSALQLRARRTGVQLYNGLGDRPTLEARLRNDLVRCETAITMLRPLAEGMALFTEFDALSGPNSRVLSVPAELTGAFFGLRQFRDAPGGVHFFGDTHRTPLLGMRRSPDFARRRRGVLLHSFEVAHGGYLPGYLTVRNIWAHLVPAEPRLVRETDLFLMYLRSFFYDDQRLVGLLLDDGLSGFEAGAAVAAYLAERFDQLESVKPEHFAAYEDALLHDSGRGPLRDFSDEASAALSESLLLPREAHELGACRAKQFIDELEEPDLESVDGLMQLWDAEVLRHRDVMYLGTMSVGVKVDAAGQCVVTMGDTSGAPVSALPGVAPGEGDGWLDVFFSILTTRKARASVIYRAGEQVALSYGGPDSLTEDARVRFQALGMDVRTAQGGSEEMQANMEKVVAARPSLDDVREMRLLAEQASVSIYTNMSLLHVADEDEARVRALLGPDGLLDLLGSDEDLIDGLAIISLGWPAGLGRANTLDLLRERGLDPQRTLSRLEACARQSGMPLLVDAGAVFLTRV